MFNKYCQWGIRIFLVSFFYGLFWGNFIFAQSCNLSDCPAQVPKTETDYIVGTCPDGQVIEGTITRGATYCSSNPPANCENQTPTCFFCSDGSQICANIKKLEVSSGYSCASGNCICTWLETGFCGSGSGCKPLGEACPGGNLDCCSGACSFGVCVPPSGCTPSCSCASDTCIGSTCLDSCGGGTCNGTKNCCKGNSNFCNANWECCSNICCWGNFCCSPYSLQIFKNGAGSGIITSNPTGINCGTTCSHVYLLNETVDLTPFANPGSVFAGWSGSCSGAGACSVIMSQNRTITATFNLLLPASKGFIKVRTPQGIRKLNLISIADAKAAGHGLIKVKTANPASPFAADLVLTSDPGYYPVRVRTSLGTFKWRTIP